MLETTASTVLKSLRWFQLPLRKIYHVPDYVAGFSAIHRTNISRDWLNTISFKEQRIPVSGTVIRVAYAAKTADSIVGMMAVDGETPRADIGARK